MGDMFAVVEAVPWISKCDLRPFEAMLHEIDHPAFRLIGGDQRAAGGVWEEAGFRPSLIDALQQKDLGPLGLALRALLLHVVGLALPEPEIVLDQVVLRFIGPDGLLALLHLEGFLEHIRGLDVPEVVHAEGFVVGALL